MTPTEMAKVFSNMDAEEQAEFFSALAVEVKTWDDPSCGFAIQMNIVKKEAELTPDGLTIMEAIGNA